MEAIRRIRSRTVAMPAANIDTDQIIPARFLTRTTRDGLGAHLFADWRYDPDGAPRPDFVLNRDDARGASILIAGPNFGCGSSREHAPWALLDYGFKAVVSTAIADIFRSNALKNGLLPVIVHEGTVAWLLAHPGAEITLDLERTLLTLPTGESVPFPIERFSRYCLLNGLDELDFLLRHAGDIENYEQRAAGSRA